MPKFITDDEKRIGNISTEKLFTYLNSWGINLTIDNFQDQVKKYNSILEIENVLTSAINPLPFYISNNLYFILDTLWKRLIDDKLLVDHVIGKIANNLVDDDQIDISLWDEISPYIATDITDTAWKISLFEYFEIVKWIEYFIEEYFYKTIEAQEINIFLDFLEEFSKIDWEKISTSIHLHFNIVRSVFKSYIGEVDETDEIMYKLFIDYPEYITDIQRVHKTLIMESIDIVKPGYYNQWINEYEENREMGGIEKISQTLDQNNLDDEIIILEDIFKKLKQKTEENEFSSEDQETPLVIMLICWECGLSYNAICDHLIVNSDNYDNITKTSTKPDNGNFIFPLEVRCPICDGYRFVVPGEIKEYDIGLRLSNKDKRIIKMSFQYSNNKQIKSFSDVISGLKHSLKRTKDKSDVYINIGNIYRKLNFYDQAKKYYLRAKNNNSDNPQLYFNLGEIYLSRNDMKRAKYCFRYVEKNNEKYIENLLDQNILSKKTIELLNQL